MVGSPAATTKLRSVRSSRMVFALSASFRRLCFRMVFLLVRMPHRREIGGNIRPMDVGAFLVAQAIGAAAGGLMFSWLVPVHRTAALPTEQDAAGARWSGLFARHGADANNEPGHHSCSTPPDAAPGRQPLRARNASGSFISQRSRRA